MYEVHVVIKEDVMEFVHRTRMKKVAASDRARWAHYFLNGWWTLPQWMETIICEEWKKWEPIGSIERTDDNFPCDLKSQDIKALIALVRRLGWSVPLWSPEYPR